VARQKLNDENCKAARSNLQVLQNTNTVYLQDAKGEKVPLDKEQRQKQTDAANDAIKKFCAPS